MRRQSTAMAAMTGHPIYILDARGAAVGAAASPLQSSSAPASTSEPVQPGTALGRDSDGDAGWQQKLADDAVATLRAGNLPRPSPLAVPPLGFPEEVAAWRAGGTWKPREVAQRADEAMTQYYNHIAQGMQPDQAAAWASNIDAESRGNYQQHQKPKGPAYGLMQWEPARRQQFRDLFGIAMEDATEKQQYQFRDWELHRHWGWRDAIDQADNAGDRSAMIMSKFEGPAEQIKAGKDRANLANAILERARADAERRKR